MLAKAVANNTKAAYIRANGSEFVQKVESASGYVVLCAHWLLLAVSRGGATDGARRLQIGQGELPCDYFH